FLALTLGPGAVVLMKIARDWKKPSYSSSRPGKSRLRLQKIKLLLTAAGLSLILAGIFLSQSRGGMIVGLMVAAVCIAGIINVPRSMSLSSRTRWGQVPSSRGNRPEFALETRMGARLLAVGVIVVASFLLAVTFGRQDPFQRTVAMLQGILASEGDRKSTRLNSSHVAISYAVFCLKKKKTI